MKILIVKLGSIGDIVHTLPALAAIHHGLPDAEISWVVEKRSAEILRGNPMISRLIEIDTKSLRRNVNPRKFLGQVRSELQQLRDVKFDVALDFQGLLKSALVGKLSGAKKIYGFSSRSLKEPASRIFLDKAVRTSRHSNVIFKNLNLANRALKLDLPASSPEMLSFPIRLDDAHRAEAEQAIAKIHGDFAILNPGGGWPAKLWPAERFGQLADLLWKELGLASIVTYGPGEEELAVRVVNSAVSQKAFSADISLKGFFALAQKAAIYIGGDTGPTHLAVAANTPVVGIFGPTEWWRNGSPRKEDIGVKHEGVAAHTCTRRSDSNCPCMDIAVERVFQAVRHRLNKSF
ncbi:MAG TPA: lipopolysaccharide heptosyltransferase I [Pyrinomonadaceae bacterium]|jgi:lipopolysaccharide heptosyltransferase I|nr:lipopolysaccharide heptosyltransferase I [Pyrinomonadaceae bacterium]